MRKRTTCSSFLGCFGIMRVGARGGDPCLHATCDVHPSVQPLSPFSTPAHRHRHLLPPLALLIATHTCDNKSANRPASAAPTPTKVSLKSPTNMSSMPRLPPLHSDNDPVGFITMSGITRKLASPLGSKSKASGWEDQGGPHFGSHQLTQTTTQWDLSR